MEIKNLENCDYVMFPRLLEQGVEFRHVERDAFKAELRHVEGRGDFWLLHQQEKPHVMVHIQLAKDENDFDNILGWFIGQQKLHEFIRGDFTFISAYAGCSGEELPMRYPDNIKCKVYFGYLCTDIVEQYGQYKELFPSRAHPRSLSESRMVLP